MMSELPPEEAPQRVVKVRRDYNSWVARETLEDYALRFTPHGFRRWSVFKVANTAFGAASFLVLEAVGATLVVQFGFLNAFWAILATGLIIFLAGVPVSLYAARYGVDMDLLTRGAGFGYLGSTITSLIYASFTFIFFALEAAIMAYALELAFDIPPAWGYLACALLVIPLVTHGVTAISRLQALTQPLWLVMLVAPYVYVLGANPGLIGELSHYGGLSGRFAGFDVYAFGAGLTVGIALITQMGEQADYLRFMPAAEPGRRGRWLAGVLIGGPGWVLPGVLKMLGGALLAYLAISHSVPAERAVDPNQMYLAAYEYVFPYQPWAIAATAFFVIVSQLKINVTNAYAGSLAWSNFFARLTHSHPGRVVWVVFNTLIALMLMELDVFQALGRVLGLYSNIAISWMMAVVADLVINKPLGLSPKGIEFRRAHLFDVNPVGVGAMGIASLLSVSANLGLFGPEAEAFSALIALVTAFVAAPAIAWATGGRYYLARRPAPAAPGLQRCAICEREYEAEDMAHCPAYQGHICSLCCSLDARCQDLCKPEARLSAQWAGLLRRFLPESLCAYLESGLGVYLVLIVLAAPVLAILLWLMYVHEIRVLGDAAPGLAAPLRLVFIKAYAAVLLVAGIVVWWLVLTHKSRQVAQEESNRQTHLLMQEIESHRRTDEQLQKAKLAAELANQAKSRYISSISHELRTPLNSILGYAQILDGDPAIPAHRRQAVNVIRRSGDHLLSLIEGTLDIARIEGGKLTLEVKALAFPDFLHQIVNMIAPQARAKGLDFRFEPVGELPAVVRADEKRLRQILINILGNAVKFTSSGQVVLRVRYVREMASFAIEDSGPGIAAAELERIFEPFARGDAAEKAAGSGLGLTISKMFADVMGGELKVDSELGRGSCFTVRLYLPRVHSEQAARELPRRDRIGYFGPRRRILTVDNERDDRELLAHILVPLGFQVEQAASGEECLEVLPRFQPDLIFMDLAMPGMDGWETIRRIRAGGLSAAPVAVISANAFERGLNGPENAIKLPPEDFILKPVKVAELLAWIGRRLELEWIEAAPQELSATMGKVPAPAPRAGPALPAALAARLRENIALGYLRGILATLDELEAVDAEWAAFAEQARRLARGFDFEALANLIGKHAHA